MKRPNNELLVLILLVIIALFAWDAAFAIGRTKDETKGIQFFKGTWGQALEKAKQENKTVFVDFYADWCGPCRYMSKNVFTDSAVGAYFDKEMIALQINAEKEELDLVKQMQLNAYPTLALFNGNGQKLTSYEGALEAPTLIKFARSVSELETTKEAFKADTLNVEKFTAYIDYLVFKESDEVNALVTAFLNNLPDDKLKSQAAWDLIVSRFAEYNSRTFDFLTANMAWYEKNVTDFDNNFAWFINKMMSDAAENKDQKIVNKALASYLGLRKSNNSMVQSEQYYKDAFHVAYYFTSGDTTMYRSELPKFLDTYHAKDADLIASNVMEILGSAPNESTIKLKCIQMAKNADHLKHSAFTVWVLGLAYQVNGELKEAKKYMMQALKETREQDLIISAGSGGIMSVTTPASAILVTGIPSTFQ